MVVWNIFASAIIMVLVNSLPIIVESFLPYMFATKPSVEKTNTHHKSGIGFHNFTISITM
jgi:hypothetical protein